MIGNIIVDQVSKTRNWPLASAFSMILTLVSTVGVIWMMMSSRKEQAQKKNVTNQQKTEQNILDHHTTGGEA